MGLAAGSGPTVTARTRQRLAWATAAAALLLVMTVPWRWGFERRDADLAGVSLGLSPWQRDEAGTRFRSAQRKATVFVSRDSPVVRIPLRSPDQAARHVEIFLNGRLVASVVLIPDRWVDAQVPLPRRRGMPAHHRIDLVVEPSSVATSRQGRAADGRTAGGGRALVATLGASARGIEGDHSDGGERERDEHGREGVPH